MKYDELERLKVQADRWIACVASDASTAGEASRGIRALLDEINVKLEFCAAAHAELVRLAGGPPLPGTSGEAFLSRRSDGEATEESDK